MEDGIRKGEVRNLSLLLYPITCMTKAYGKVRKDTRQYVSPVLTRIVSVINKHVEIPNVSREAFI